MPSKSFQSIFIFFLLLATIDASSDHAVKGVIFDIAGTIVDHGSKAPIIAFQKLFESIDIQITEAEAREPMGTEKREHIRQLLSMPRIKEQWISIHNNAPDEKDIDKLYHAFADYLIVAIGQTSAPISGLTDTLDFLQRTGCKVACNTGYAREMADAIKPHFDKIGFNPESWICATEVPRGRPFPDMSLKNAIELGLAGDVKACIKVDDTTVGIKEGVNAGMWTVGVAVSGNEVGLSESDWNKLSPQEKILRKEKAYKNLTAAGAHFVIDSIADLPSVIEEINLRLANGKTPDKRSIDQSHYLLLTPGPLTTSKSVKETMLNDFCTWDRDYNEGIVQAIRKRLVCLATEASGYTSALLQGSGSYCIESTLQSFIGDNDKALIIINGVYGERIAKMCQYIGINNTTLIYKENEIPKLEEIEQVLIKDKSITYVISVHCETTSGILNPIKDICTLAKKYNKTTLIDAMSSFGGMQMDVDKWQIDILVSSANKCLQGVPGFGFVICKESLIKEAVHSRSLCLDLNAQWQAMNPTGKWRYTSPTHTVRAFLQALTELEKEGGITARFKRYKQNQQLLNEGMHSLGFETLVEPANQSAFITSFSYPDSDFDFDQFYNLLKKEGFVIYPGKLTNTPSFRIGNIGEVYPKDMVNLLAAIKKVQSYVQK